jgi:predicted nucleic acid-binding Zn ribbon protein
METASGTGPVMVRGGAGAADIVCGVPIYEYRRPDGTTFELLQSMRDDALTHDPETGVPVERVLHAPAVHFKGSGFYNTDYGTRKRSRELKEAGEGSSNGSKDGDSGSSKDTAKKDGGGDGKSSSTTSTSSSTSSSSSSSTSSSKSSSSSD